MITAELIKHKVFIEIELVKYIRNAYSKIETVQKMSKEFGFFVRLPFKHFMINYREDEEDYIFIVTR